VTAEPLDAAPPPRLFSGLVLIVGLALLLGGPLAGGLFVLLSMSDSRLPDLASVTIGLSLAILGLGFGAALLWAGYQSFQRREARPFQPAMGWFWACVAGLAVALAVGQLIVSLGRLAAMAVAFFHVLAIALPAIGILILAARGLKDSSRTAARRQVIGEMSLGAFGATAVSLTLEGVAGVSLLLVAILLTPDAVAQLVTLRGLLSGPSLMQNPQMLADRVLKPWILIPLIILFVIIGPLIEEATKSLGIPLLFLWRGEPPSPAQGWLWGMAAGAGFAITEGVFNGAAGVDFFVVIALLRAGATLMHMTTAGLTGRGWAGTLAERRVWPLLRGYLAAVTLHATWNGMTLLIAISSIWMTVHPNALLQAGMAGLGALVGVVGLIVLLIATASIAVYHVLRLKRQSGETSQP
jgi:RsiW-degrading membrane proteinase PrsW (M82 family)